MVPRLSLLFPRKTIRSMGIPELVSIPCTLSSCSIIRTFATTTTTRKTNESSYIDQWLRSIRKPQLFYDKYGNGVSISVPTRTDGDDDDDVIQNSSSITVRCYFYNIDLNGNVYLEEIERKDRTSCVKDIKFLNYLMDNIQPTIATEGYYHHQQQEQQQRKQQQRRQPPRRRLIHHYFDDISLEEYPYVAYCGLYECNFIRPADTPIVFHTYQTHSDNNNNNNDNNINTINNNNIQSTSAPQPSVLLYGGTIQQPFDVSCLRISQRTGRLYHEITNPPKRLIKNYNSILRNDNYKYYGLIRSAVSVTLSEHIVPMDNNYNNANDDDDNDNEFSGMGYCVDHDSSSANDVVSSLSVLLSDDCTPSLSKSSTVATTGNVIPIRWLPSYAEPDEATYAMPYVPD